MFENIRNIESKMNKNEKFAKMLKKVLNEIITNEIYKKSSTKKKIIDISWNDDPRLINKINNDVTTNRYRKDINSTELLSIQNFLDAINNEDIKNKDDARKKLKKFKKKC